MSNPSPDRAASAGDLSRAPLLGALKRGFTRRCPACGSRGIFSGYLKVAAACPGCALPVGEYRADDAPPYFTIFIVGHVVIPAVLTVERHWHPPAWVHAAFWVPATLLLTLALLPLVKGAVIGAQWAFRIKG
jgi:uncharacterized protein (DUF983 family)